MSRRRKSIPTVQLERQAHRDAKERLRKAYRLLIQAKQSEQQYTDNEEQEGTYEEVKS